MPPKTSNEILAVLGEQMNNFKVNVAQEFSEIKETIEKFEKKFDAHAETDGRRIGDIERWKYIFTGALLIMNAVFLPLFIWLVTHLLEKRI